MKTLIIGLAAIVASTPAAANLIANGGFEKAPLVPFLLDSNYPNGQIQPYPNPPITSQYLPDWTIASPEVSDLSRSPVNYGNAPVAAFEGQQYLLLNWSPLGAITLDNSISQGFTLGAGATGIAFSAAMSVESGFTGSTLQVNIFDSDNNIVAQSPLFTHLDGNRVWSQKSWSANLGPGAYTLSLHGIGAGNAWDVHLDDVVLTQIGSAGAVPEPASWAMLIAGFGLTGAAMRRRRQVAA